MAGARQSKASHRRDREARESSTQERVTLVAIGVLAAVAIIAVAGVIWGVILPPRAHVITVGNASFTAGQVAERAIFLVAGKTQGSDDPVNSAVIMLRREETLLQLGAAEAGEITDADIKKGVAGAIGLPEGTSDDDFKTQYDFFLKGSNVDRTAFERMVRGQVISERLSKKFEAEVGASGPQIHPMGVQSRDQGKIKQLRDAVAGGADFITKARELGLVPANQTPDFGWMIPPVSGFLKDTVQLEKLQAGQMTEIIERDFQYEVYRMAERDENRTYNDVMKRTLADRKVDDWVKAQSEKLKITEDLSDGERRWILKQVVSEAQKIAERRSKLTPPPLTPRTPAVTVDPGTPTPTATPTASPGATATGSPGASPAAPKASGTPTASATAGGR